MSEAYVHRPVMVEAVLQALRVRQGGAYVDATLGGGGHAEAILEASAPDGELLGCDIDPEAVAAARSRLARFGERARIERGSYTELSRWGAAEAWDGALFDFGASSFHFDSARRGFSFQEEGPLDMRFDPDQEETAADLVNRADPEELARIFRELGDVRPARRLARRIAEARRRGSIETTRELVSLIEETLGTRRGRIHPATKVFMALRMAVNRELERIREGLEAAWRLLCPGGRLVCLTFHSGEVRAVRAFGRKLAASYETHGEVDLPEFRRPRPPQLRWIARRAIRPSQEEIAGNPRARSAALYAMEKLEALQ